MTKAYVGCSIAGAAVIGRAFVGGYAATQRVAAAATAEATPPTYLPVTSDLMNAIIQPRHIKLWLAGRTQNWTLAEYERHNLQGAVRPQPVAPVVDNRSIDIQLDCKRACTLASLEPLDGLQHEFPGAAFGRAPRHRLALLLENCPNLSVSVLGFTPLR